MYEEVKLVNIMEEEMPEFEDYCSRCDEETRNEFVGREDEYFIYECSLCGEEEKLTKDEMEQEMEDEWEEWEKDWEE